jgi:general stress protein YciG
MSDSRTFSNDSDFAAEQGRKGGANQPDEIYKREYIHMHYLGVCSRHC